MDLFHNFDLQMFAEEEGEADATTNSDDNSSEPNEGEGSEADRKYDKSEFNEVVAQRQATKEALREAIAKQEELQKKLDSIEAAKAKDDPDAARKALTITIKAELKNDTLAAENEDFKKVIEDYRELGISEEKISGLMTSHSELFRKKVITQPPTTKSVSGNSKTLSADELAMAKQFGMTADEFRHYQTSSTKL